ncbi:hypothetical protein HBA54_27165 [Pelagibius litoralis]|uniref:Uncharacterized protein n=1 Tax=Pelagibius litoralis TaxID=374515 RepID=A0A967F3E6_9PROT|nr:hypothetical protein [Pelagibius litoralis]NIA72278.1 hypothetical protein [Pelagibius litoralis]
MRTDPVTDNPNVKLAKPVDPYDSAWPAWNAQNPLILRSVGADAAADAGDGGDAGAGDGGGGDTQPGGEGADTAAGGDGGDKTALGGGGDAAKKEAAADWRAGLGDDLKPVAEKFTSPADVVKSYSELQKRLGNSVLLPGKDAKPEEIAAFHKKLGVPESPEGYKVELPKELPEELKPNEAAQESTKDFLKAMHGAGATPGVVQTALSWYYGSLQAGSEQKAANEKKATEEANAALEQEWGEDAKANDAFGVRAVKEFGGDDFAEFLETKEIDGIKVGDHPAFRRAFANIGRKMGEGRPLVEGDSEAAGTVQERIDELHALQDKDPKKYASQAVQNELRDLYGKLYGSQPIVGQEGRTL